MQKKQNIRIGTRGSNLALAQAHIVEKMLHDAHSGIKTDIITIKTTGDKILEKNLYEIGGKGLFIKEIEEQLLDKSIDIAVHSMKDMPAFMHEKLEVPCILEREDSRDALISEKSANINDLSQGATVGTSSPRRAAQALHIRPDLKIVPFRGNIHTRIEKLQKNTVNATFLAMAGLNRCKISNKMINPISTKDMLPAVAQGAIGIEICKDNEALKKLLLPLNHPETHTCIIAERAFLQELDGSCSTPIGALAKIDNENISINFMIASMDGKTIHRTSRKGNIKDAEKLGREAALELKEKAGEGFFN